MNALEKKIHQRLGTLSPSVAPGLLLRVYHHGRQVADLDWGKTWMYYDLASLTKIFFTVPWMMRSAFLKQVDLNQPLQKYLPWYPHSVVVKNLLSHSAGNEWWQPFYKSLCQEDTLEMRKMVLKEQLRKHAPASKVSKAVYSDIDFLLMGFLLETVQGKTWSELWGEVADVVFKKKDMFFLSQKPTGKFLEKFAPTEKCPWRGRILQGEVHDENAWALQGVAPHSGLFGTMDAVGEWALWFRSEYYGIKERWTSEEITQQFTRRAVPVELGDWALGFMLPTKGSASCGSYFSSDSFGHTGFTGTSFWMDPDKDLMVLLLSNRVHPTRHNELFKKARPQIHDWVCESLGEQL